MTNRWNENFWSAAENKKQTKKKLSAIPVLLWTLFISSCSGRFEELLSVTFRYHLTWMDEKGSDKAVSDNHNYSHWHWCKSWYSKESMINLLKRNWTLRCGQSLFDLIQSDCSFSCINRIFPSLFLCHPIRLIISLIQRDDEMFSLPIKLLLFSFF